MFSISVNDSLRRKSIPHVETLQNILSWPEKGGSEFWITSVTFAWYTSLTALQRTYNASSCVPTYWNVLYALFLNRSAFKVHHIERMDILRSLLHTDLQMIGFPIEILWKYQTARKSDKMLTYFSFEARCSWVGFWLTCQFSLNDLAIKYNTALFE